MVLIWIAIVLSITGMVATAAWTVGSNVSGLLPSQSRNISATRNASSNDCWVFSRGSQAVS